MGDNGNITISGGTVIVNGGKDNKGIDCGPNGTFSTGENGTAFINVNNSTITNAKYKEESSTKGLIIDGHEGKIYGDSYNITADATIEYGQTLVVGANQTLTIKEGATLTIKRGATLTIADDATLTIADGATLTNNGEIKCDGIVNGNISDDYKIKYAVTCNLNYDITQKEEIVYVEDGKSPSKYEPSRDYYTFKGWFTQSDGGDQVTTITKATTVYAHWVEIVPKIKQPIEDIIATYGTYFEKELTPEMFIENASELREVNINDENIQDLPAGLNIENSHIKGIPTKAGDITAKIRVVCKLWDGAEINIKVEVTFKVNTAPLTITPKPNQKLFEDEIPAYEVTGAVMGEDPKLTGSLAIQDGKVVINDLQLETPFSDNYFLSLTPDIPITIINNETANSLVQLNGTTNTNGAYIDEVTVTAPEGFLIALESSQLKSPLNYSKSFTWNQEGTYTLSYRLKRESGEGSESGIFQMEIKIIKSKPDTEPDTEPIDPPVVITYDVELPEVEGIRIDVGAGIHKVESWGTFKFTITVDEGYRLQSLPVVKVNDSEIACSSRTDTTFTYKIKYIRTPKEISITGIVKDPATANNAIESPQESWKIINGVAYITVAKPTVFTVVDMNGNIISTNKLAPGETAIYNLPRAKPIIFWFDKQRAEKVIIK